MSKVRKINGIEIIDTYITGASYSNNLITLNRNDNEDISFTIDSFSGLSISGEFSANTFYSAGTSLETIITSIASGLDTNDVTRVQNGLNTYTGGTSNLPTVNVSGLSIDSIFVSGDSRFNSITGGTISASTFYSGETSLETVIINIASSLDTNDVTRVQNGLNTYTGGTSNLPTVNISGGSLDNIFVSGNSRFNSITGSTISASTFYSGETSLETIINNYGQNYVFTANTNATLKTINFVVNGGTTSISTGAKGIVRVPYSGTIINWSLISDLSSTTTVDIWKSSGYIPTNTDSICGSGTKPNLSSNTISDGSIDWTSTTISVNDVLRMEVESNDVSTYLSLTLTIKMF